MSTLSSSVRTGTRMMPPPSPSNEPRSPATKERASITVVKAKGVIDRADRILSHLVPVHNHPPSVLVAGLLRHIGQRPALEEGPPSVIGPGLRRLPSGGLLGWLWCGLLDALRRARLEQHEHQD